MDYKRRNAMNMTGTLNSKACVKPMDMETKQFMTFAEAIRTMQRLWPETRRPVMSCETCEKIFGACQGNTEECEKRYFMFMEEN